MLPRLHHAVRGYILNSENAHCVLVIHIGQCEMVNHQILKARIK